MKKRILSLLLVLCMVVGMLPASVFAADTTESTEITATADALIRMRADETAITAIEGKVGSWTPVSGYYYVSVTLQPGDGSYYFNTNDAGYVIDGTEDDHTIEINYLGNAAKVILKGAAIANDHESFPALFLGTSKDNAGEGPDTAVGNQADYEIIVEGDSSITQSIGNNSRAIYGSTVGTVTITSADDALLTVSAKSIHNAFGYIHNRGDLFLKNANVFINGTTYGPKLYSRTGNVTIDGGDFNAVGTVYNGSTSKNYRGIYAAGNVTIQNGAVVNFYYPTGYVLYAENGEITIKDSAVALGSDYARLFNKEPNLVFADGAKTVELRQDKSPGKTVDATTGRVTVNPLGTVVEYDETTFAADYLAYRYFKVSPGNKGSGTVNLPSSDGSISYNVAAGADTKYFTVVDGLPVQITEQASFKDYKLKLEYPVNGVLTLTLNGAQLTTSGMNGIHVISSATCPIKIVTEADSTVIASKDTGGGGRAFFDSGVGMMTFTSENDATLTVSGMANSLNGYIQSKADILFENANIFADAYVGRDGGSYAVYALGNVTVKGGRFVHERVAEGTRAAAYGAIKGSNITFEDADVKVITQANTSVSAWDATPGYIFKADAAENPAITLKNTTLKAGIIANYGDGATGLFNVPPTLVYDVGCDAKGTADIAALDAEGNFKAMTNPVTLTSDDANAITYRHVEIAPHEHRYEDRVSSTLASAATCEHGDLYYVQCHNCEQISEKTIETTAPKAHTWTDATCTSGKVCSVCKKEFAYGVDPFYMVNLANMDNISNVYGMPHFWADDNNVVEYNGESDVYKIAAMLKATFDAYPVGARYINFTLVAQSFKSTYKNGIYMDEGVKITQDWLNKFLPAYKAIGGQLDGISIDLEFEYGRAEDLKKIYDGSHDAFTEEVDGKKVPVANKGIYKDIYFAKDEDGNLLFETTGMKQMMIDRGVTFDENAEDPLYIIHDTHSKAYAAYNEAFYILMNRYVDKAMEPLSKYYPDARLFDYDRGYSEAWQGLGLNSGSGVAQGTANRVGNSSNMSLYMMDPSYLIFEYGWKPYGYNKGTFAATAFNAAKYNVERFKKMLAATPVEEDGSKNVSVWIAEYNFSVNTREAWTNNSPYYAEAILHLGLSNPSPFIGYVKPPVLKDENGDPILNEEGKEQSDVETYNKYLAAVNSLMVELTLVAGTDDRTPIELPYSWNDDYILSGMKAGGRNIWRITPEDGLKDFLVWSENGTPTFRAGGQTIIFPQGRIVTTGNTIDYEYGTCGYWVETPEGVNPVVVSDTDRYSANGYTGVETKADLYVYNEYGYTVDKNVVNEGFTAYYVNWMNVDNTYKYLIIRNNGEKIREELMAPGQDGFFVGEIESGNNLLTVETVDATGYEAEDPYASDDFYWADATEPNHDYKYVDNEDGTHDYVCDCGEEGAVAIDNEAHEFDDENDTTCDKCGYERELGPKSDPNMVINKISLSFQKEIGLQFMVKNTVLSGYDSYYAEIIHQKVDGTDRVELPGELVFSNIQFNHNIQAWSMSELVTITLYGVKDGVLYKGETRTTSVAEQGYEKLETYKTAGNTKTCVALANMLTYGAAVQVQQDHGDLENLPDKRLEELGYDSYVTKTIPDFTAVDEVSGTGSIEIRSKSLSLQARVEPGLIFKQSMVGYKAVIMLDGVVIGEAYPDATMNRMISFAVEAYNMRNPYTVTIYDVETGAVVSPTYIYSVESVAHSKLSTTGDQPLDLLFYAMLNYGDAVAALL